MPFLDVMGALERRVRRGDLMTYGHGPPTTKVFGLAADLRGKDHLLEVTDSLIIACAFEDSHCQVFYTLDATLLRSSVISSEARLRRKKVLPPG